MEFNNWADPNWVVREMTAKKGYFLAWEDILQSFLKFINQSQYVIISRVVSHFYRTEYETWAGFGPVGRTENFELGDKVCNFWGKFFYVFNGNALLST